MATEINPLIIPFDSLLVTRSKREYRETVRGWGEEPFEVRKNDRNFMVGDEVVFKVLIDKGSYVGAEAAHPLNGIVYRIDYVLNNFEGLAQKYVAFSISREG